MCLQCRRPPQLDAAFHGGGKAGVDPLAGYSTLKLRDCHEYAELKIARRVLLRSVDSLAAGDKRDLQPADFIQDQSQMRQAATQPVQFVHHQAPDSPATDVLNQPVEFGARRLGPGNLVGINNGVLPAPLAALTPELLLLAIGALALGADSYIDRGVHKTLPLCTTDGVLKSSGKAGLLACRRWGGFVNTAGPVGRLMFFGKLAGFGPPEELGQCLVGQVWPACDVHRFQPATLPPPPCRHVRNPRLFAELMQALDGSPLYWEG